MKKYRIVRRNDKYYAQEKVFVFWVFSIDIGCDSIEEAESMIRGWMKYEAEDWAKDTVVKEVK